jgi:hypothetical protein
MLAQRLLVDLQLRGDVGLGEAESRSALDERALSVGRLIFGSASHGSAIFALLQESSTTHRGFQHDAFARPKTSPQKFLIQPEIVIGKLLPIPASILFSIGNTRRISGSRRFMPPSRIDRSIFQQRPHRLRALARVFETSRGVSACY